MEPSPDFHYVPPAESPPPKNNPEVGESIEPLEQRPAPEQSAPAINRDHAPAATPPPQLPAAPVDDPGVATPPPVSNVPQIADDVDIIEMEWVDKAKEIDKGFAGDPHGKANAIFHLQREYLRKRYGKQLGAPEEYTD